MFTVLHLLIPDLHETLILILFQICVFIEIVNMFK